MWEVSLHDHRPKAFELALLNTDAPDYKFLKTTYGWFGKNKIQIASEVQCGIHIPPDPIFNALINFANEQCEILNRKDK